MVIVRETHGATRMTCRLGSSPAGCWKCIYAPCGFWCLNDKMIKELIRFAKCKTGKMSCDYVEIIHSSRYTLWPIWLHILNVIKTRRTSSSKKEENELMMIINISTLKTQRVVWIMMVIEEGSIRAWSWWTIHQRRASGSLDVEVPVCDGEEASEYLSLRYQSCHIESHSSKCWYLWDQEIKVTWTRRDVLIV
jgi:hypothetical protein